MSLSLLLAVAVIAYVALSTVWSIIFKKRCFVRLICLAAVAVISVTATFIIKSIVTTPEKLLDLVGKLPGSDGLVDALGSMIATSEPLAEVISGISAALLAPSIFLAIFSVLLSISFILRAILAIIFLIIPIKLRPKTHTRACLGFAYGLIMMFCTLIPVSAYLGTASTALPAVKDMGILDEASYTEIAEPIEELNSSAVIKVHRAVGGNLIIKPMTNIEVTLGDETVKTTLNSEIGAVLDFAADAVKLTSVPMDQYTETETAALEALVDKLPDSKLLSVTATEVIRLATDAWMKGEPFMGIPQPSLGEDFDPLLDRTVTILNSDSGNVDNLCEDIKTFAKLVTKIVIATKPSPDGSQPDMANALMKDGLIRELLTEINKNQRMRPLIPVVTNIGLKMVAEQLGIPKSSEDAYNTFSDAVAKELAASAALDDSARIDNMESAIRASLSKLSVSDVADNEISIIALSLISYYPAEAAASASPETVSGFLTMLTDSIDNEGGGVTPVSANRGYGYSKLDAVPENDAKAAGKLISDICAIQNDPALTPEQKATRILAAFNSSRLVTASSIPEDKLAEIAGIISAARPSDKANGSVNAVKGLVPNAETSSFKVTVTVVLITDTAIDGSANMSEQDMQKFIDSVSGVFNSAASITSGEGSLDIGELCDSLGTMLDVLSENEELYGKEKTDALTGLILKSEAVNQATGIAPEDIDAILEKKNEKDVSYSALLGSVSNTTSILDSIKNGAELTDEKINELVVNLTNEGAGEVIATVITEAKLKELGFKDGEQPGKVACAAELLRGVFTNVSLVTDPEKHASETVALKRLISLAIDANKNKEAQNNAFGAENSRFGCTASQIIDDILASEAVCDTVTSSELVHNPFGVKLTAEDKLELQSAIAEKSLNADADTLSALNKISVLFGASQNT